ncbi:polysaccharide deacetylase family protein [Geobacter sulfurreducens]|uniref:polysaccharide deacetylase family protein n=1 Tax=Geobacter sulfurreducens TaxID=35554 RepID=UPI000DBB1213|nr:polysaccharide deacetylase family protein [Geobacter sulfurreducens]BBA69956.1 Poly-beta-1,6-N-acetyl-D-glucosamine N-deacetylase [Geobacter sulfurreducens]
MNVSRRQFLIIGGAALAAMAVPLPVSARKETVVPVLMYHDVSNHFHDPFTILPALFAAHMEWLHAAGYRAVTVGEALAGRGATAGKMVVITFDDGYASFLDYVHPLLLQYGFSAAISVIGSHVGTWLERDGRRPMLSWDEYRYLAARRVEVGCHAYHLHAIERLRHASAGELAEDLELFQKTMAREMGRRATLLAWPYGIYTFERVQIARQAGFVHILTSNEGYVDDGTDPGAIPRLNIDNRLDLVSFSNYLRGE